MNIPMENENCLNTNAVLPHIINGPLSPDNHGAFAWSDNGYLAFAAAFRVYIVETGSKIRLVQNLRKHQSYITRLAWEPRNEMYLLSADKKGILIVWNVLDASVQMSVIPKNKEETNVIEIAWVDYLSFSTADEEKITSKRKYHLLVLYNQNNFVLYDRNNGDILWKKKFSPSFESVDYFFSGFKFDPRNNQNVLLSISNASTQITDCCFATINDFFQVKNSLKIYQIYLANCEETALGSPKMHLYNNTSTVELQRYIKMIGQSLVRKNNQPITASHLLEYKQLLYHSSNKNQALAVFDREIHVIDLYFGQILCVIRCENNNSNFLQVYSCWQRQMLFCLHQSGLVSVRLLQKKTKFDNHIGTDVLELSYATIAISEGLRLTKFNKIFGFQVDQIRELDIALISNNAKIYIYKLHSPNHLIKKLETKIEQDLCLERLVPMSAYTNFRSVSLSLIMHKYFSSVTAGGHVMRMCPPSRPRVWFFHKALLAIGDSTGVVQIYNLATNQLEKEYSIHTVPVKGIEWPNLKMFLSYAHGQSGNKPTNELKITELHSGYSISIREEKNLESSSIECIKISSRKKYFIIAFKNDPFEIWDLEKLCCLRQLNVFSSQITSMEWNPNSKKENQNRIKEYFTITNADSELYHFSVEGHTVRQVSSSSHMSSLVTATAWKNDRLVFGDVDGSLMLWNLHSKVSKAEATMRGHIRKIMFAPGKESTLILVLYQDGVDVWDTTELKLISYFKSSNNENASIDDIDWAAMDKPILLFSNGCVFIADLSLKNFHSSLNTLEYYGNEEQIKDLQNEINFSNFSALEEQKKIEIFVNYLFDSSNKKQTVEEFANKCLYFYRRIGFLLEIRLLALVMYYLNIDPSPLDTWYEDFLSNDAYKDLQQERVATYELKRVQHQHNEICSELHLYLGNEQRCVQLLLETETNQKELYLKDSLKACLISLLVQGEKQNRIQSHPVIKLVATNLIANENTSEGIQLLFTIGKVMDACRYLQSSNTWNKALLLAKTNLSQSDFQEVSARWPEAVFANQHVIHKLSAFFSISAYKKVIEILWKLDTNYLAVLFCDFLLECDKLSQDTIPLVMEIYEKYGQAWKESNFEQLGEKYLQKAKSLLKSSLELDLSVQLKEDAKDNQLFEVHSLNTNELSESISLVNLEKKN